jgi:D-alanyl-D-alanine carboxypeptidase/D-alanyl-D-alanine-endopeptidase (penicillin-binding protein 4)
MRLSSILTLSISICTLAGFAQNQHVDHFFSTGSLKTASYSVYAIDANSGEKICETAQKSLSTASVMKLFTTAVALDLLGPDYTFYTTLSYTGAMDTISGTLNGDLILKGGGDPAFYSAYFEDHYKDCFDNWIRQMKRCGIKKIKGQLLLDLSVLDSKTIPGDWVWDDIGNYYGAGVSALTFGDNLYEIHFASSGLSGQLVTVLSKSPEIQDLVLENRVTSSTRSGDHTIVYGAPGSCHQYVEGTIPVNQSDFFVRAAMPDPPLVAGQTFLKRIRESGIAVGGEPTRLPQENHASRTWLGTQFSPPLKDLIVPLNKESLNLYAEHLLREIGRKSSGEPTIGKGIEAYYRFCADKGIDSNGFFPQDGSGLSRSNAFTSKTLVQTMKYVHDSKNWEIFLQSLPIAGVDGTLKNSFKGTPLEKNVRAKTGSMSRVRSIAGTMKTKKGQSILFAILVNNFDLTPAEASKLLESILLSFYND